MVNVQVKVVETLAAAFVPKARPGADAGAGVAPGDGPGDLGGVGEPEIARILDFKEVFFIKNGRVFPFGLAIFASPADLAVFGQGLGEFVELEAEGFLKAGHIGLFVAEHLENQFFT